jgi:glycosyltransferase involved in cell wall biosynthesis
MKHSIAAEGCSIAVVIPCYKVAKHILQVISSIGSDVGRIYVVDDACPEHTGNMVEMNSDDPRVAVIYHSANLGVGGAVMSGYRAAMAEGADVIVKIDGDGQMDASLIPYLVQPILMGDADYAKGNRFYDLEKIAVMPRLRLFGNACLSLITKLSSGYWDIFDPTNGYTAIHRDVAQCLPFDKISRRYFFETDMLFRLNTIRAVVIDVPMDARYADEVSNLNVFKASGEFMIKNLRNFVKRLFYNYYLRDMSIASIELPVGLALLGSGLAFGGYHWVHSAFSGTVSSPGTVMLSALPIILGLQLILAFLGHDSRSTPQRPIHRLQFNPKMRHGDYAR